MAARTVAYKGRRFKLPAQCRFYDEVLWHPPSESVPKQWSLDDTPYIVLGRYVLRCVPGQEYATLVVDMNGATMKLRLGVQQRLLAYASHTTDWWRLLDLQTDEHYGVKVRPHALDVIVVDAHGGVVSVCYDNVYFHRPISVDDISVTTATPALRSVSRDVIREGRWYMKEEVLPFVSPWMGACMDVSTMVLSYLPQPVLLGDVHNACTVTT